jgi:hypothetical protein
MGVTTVLAVLFAFCVLASASDSDWVEVPINNDALGPLPRATWSGSSIGGRSLLTFGGAVESVQTFSATFYNDLWKFTYLPLTGKGSWELLTPTGPIPSARAFHTSATVTDEAGQRHFCIFGGTVFAGFSSTNSADKFYCLDVAANEWTDYSSLSPSPAPRGGARAAARGGKFYVTAGVNSSLISFNDLWVFDIDTEAWTLLPATVEYVARHVPSGGIMEANNGDSLFVIHSGEAVKGFSFGFPNDTLEYNLNDVFGWSTTNIQEPNPPHNYACAAVSSNRKKMLLFGGDIPGTAAGCPLPENASNTLHRYKANQNRWDDVDAGGSVPPTMKRHFCERIGQSFFVFGGWNVTCAGGAITSTNHNMKVYAIDF